MSLLLLFTAICGETLANAMLKESDGFKKLYPTIFMCIGYIISFSFLSLTLLHMPLGVAYAIWGGLGTCLTALIGVYFYKEKMSKKKFLGIALIIIGVITMNIGGLHL